MLEFNLYLATEGAYTT